MIPLKSAKLLAAAIIALMAVSFFSWAALGTLKAIINEAGQMAFDERDAYWRGEIARSETEAAQAVIAQMKISHAENMKAQAEITRLKNQLENLEKQNAELPDAVGSGIDRDRSRLLNNQSIIFNPH